ncbi:MAG: hypothetical protein JXR91_15460 [Deltaproteobacteria bacterium]|nr:hypothetical protein [Deltaproteobacteria bacterium]
MDFLKHHSVYSSTILVFVLLFTLTNCVPDIESVTWDAIDYPMQFYKVTHPDGKLIVNDGVATHVEKQLNIEQPEYFFKDYSSIYNQSSKFLNYLQSTSQVNSDYIPPKDNSTLHGSEAYLQYSCIGPDKDQPSTNNQFGTIQIEGPLFSLDESIDTKKFEINGHIFMMFKKCQIENTIFKGTAPGYVDDYNLRIALSLNLQLISDNGDSHLLNQVVFLSDEVIWVIVESDSGQFTVGIIPDLDDAAFALVADSEDYQCELTENNGWTCNSNIELTEIRTHLTNLHNWLK